MRNSNKFVIFLLSFIIVAGTLVLSAPVCAGNTTPASAKNESYKGALQSELGAAYKGAGIGPNVIVDPRYAAAKIIKVFLNFLGIIFLALIVYAGFVWMTAGGNEDQVAKSKKLMFRAVIGLGIIMAAYSITWAVYKIVTLRVDQPYSSGFWIQGKGEAEIIDPWNN